MTKKQIAAGQVRSLRAIRNKLLKMSEQWIDVDEFNISILHELAEKTEAVAVDLIEEVA